MRRCGWCGSKDAFLRGWFHHDDNCRTCGISVQRGEDGFSLGAATINVILTFALLITAGAIWIVVDYPTIPVAPLLIVLGIAAVVLPIAFFPFSYTLWFAVELAMDPPSDVVLADARRRVAVAAPVSVENA